MPQVLWLFCLSHQRAVTPEHLAQMERYRAAVAAAKQTQDHAQWAISALDDVEKPMLLGPDLEAAIAKAEQNIATLDGLLLHLEAGLEADDAAQNAELLLLRQSRLAQVNSLNGLRATECRMKNNKNCLKHSVFNESQALRSYRTG